MSPNDESVRMRTEAVLAERRALRTVMAELCAAATRGDLLQHLDRYRESSERHFQAEESPGGFFECVLMAAPRHQAVLEDLREEHDLFRREADRLLVAAQTCTDDGLEALRARVRSLMDRIESHETQENAVLLEVMNTDLGAGD